MPLGPHHHAPEEFDDDAPAAARPSGRNPQPREPAPDAWLVDRLLKFARTGNQHATVIALCELGSLLEAAPAKDEKLQQAFIQFDGIRLLVNILHTEDSDCVLASLKLLAALADNVQIRSIIAHLDGIKALVVLLSSEEQTHRALAARILARLSRNSLNRSLVRHHQGIPALVSFLSSNDEGTAVASAEAIMVCSRSNAVRQTLRDANILPLLSSLLPNPSPALLVPVLGIVEQLAPDSIFSQDLGDPILGPCVTHLRHSDPTVKLQACRTIYCLSQVSALCPPLVRLGALEPLVSLLSPGPPEMMRACAGAVASFGKDRETLEKLVKLGTYSRLAPLLSCHTEDPTTAAVVASALGAAAAGSPAGRKAVRESGALKTLVGLLSSTNPDLLCNVAEVLGKCSEEPESFNLIEASDSLRLVFSLLKQSSRRVQASAAQCIAELVSRAPGAAVAVRSLVGALELLLPLLKVREVNLQARVCRAIAKIAADPENIAVLTDHGAVNSLSTLVDARDDTLRRDLALAIEACAGFGDNARQFGSQGVVLPLAKYLKVQDEGVRCAAARALHKLSLDPDNARTLYATGVLPALVELVGSGSADMQKAAAGILANIRTLTRQ